MGVIGQDKTTATQRLVYYPLSLWVYKYVRGLDIGLAYHKDNKKLDVNPLPRGQSVRQREVQKSDSVFSVSFSFLAKYNKVPRVTTRTKLVCEFCASGKPNEDSCEQQHLYFLCLKIKAKLTQNGRHKIYLSLREKLYVQIRLTLMIATL